MENEEPRTRPSTAGTTAQQEINEILRRIATGTTQVNDAYLVADYLHIPQPYVTEVLRGKI